jgi:arginase
LQLAGASGNGDREKDVITMSTGLLTSTEPRTKLSMRRSRVVLHGLPTDLGASCPGAALGPQALRAVGLPESLGKLGYTVEDRGDVLFKGATGAGGLAPDRSSAESRLHALLEYAALTSREAEADILAGDVPIFMGGDHSISIGTVAGAARAARSMQSPLFVLWLDTHADFNTPSISPSGNPHGMPLAFLCQEDEFEPMARQPWFAPVDPERCCIFGARDLDSEERRRLALRQVEIVDMRKLDEQGVVAPLRSFLDRVAFENGHLHVSFDLDVIDPTIAPGVGTPVRGGLTYREAHLVMEMLFDSRVVGSVDVVELNPLLDDRAMSAHLIVDLMGSLFGRRIWPEPSRAMM